MTATWYQAHTWSSKPYITEHQVERATDKSVWVVPGGVFRRTTSNSTFFPTRAAALQCCFEAVQAKMQSADLTIASLQKQKEEWQYQLAQLEAELLKEAM